MKELGLRKKFLYLAIGWAISLAFLESFSFIYSSFHQSDFFSLEKYLVPPQRIEKMRNGFDGELGWDRHYKTEFGQRPGTPTYRTNLLATFGDSFTHCDEVEGRFAYQRFLADALQGTVYNFGVGGYGLGQSYLRFKRYYPRVKSKFVSLGLISDSIHRTMNTYRKFHYLKTGVPLTKPTFRVKDGELVVIPNPIQEVNQLEKLRDTKFIQQLSQDEYLFKYANITPRQFPYSLNLLKTMLYKFENRSANDIVGLPNLNLWKDEMAIQVLSKIFESFKKDAFEMGGIPLIIVSPEMNDVRRFKERGSLRSTSVMKKVAQELGLPIFDGVEAFANQIIHNDADYDRYYTYHLTMDGNWVFGNLLAVFLKNLRMHEGT